MITATQLQTLKDGTTILGPYGDRYRLTRATSNPHDCWFWLLAGAVKDTRNGGTVLRAYDGSRKLAPDVAALVGCHIFL